MDIVGIIQSENKFFTENTKTNKFFKFFLLAFFKTKTQISLQKTVKHKYHKKIDTSYKEI